jgi:hypothetical protein
LDSSHVKLELIYIGIELSERSIESGVMEKAWDFCFVFFVLRRRLGMFHQVVGKFPPIEARTGWWGDRP